MTRGSPLFCLLAPNSDFFFSRKAIWTGVWDGLQNRSAVLGPLVRSIRTVFRQEFCLFEYRSGFGSCCFLAGA